MPLEPIVDYRPPVADVDVIYQDDDIVVVDKPSGLLSVPGKSSALADCMHERLRAVVKGALLVHRLDMDTSGVMIFARTKAAQRDLSRQFEKRIPQKTYVARVFGHILQDEGCVDLPLAADWPNRPLQKVDMEKGKPALTRWRVLERCGDSSRVILKPETGRSHQLRVHMLALGHPILGDRFYGDERTIGMADRLQLHAQSLILLHPVSQQMVVFEAPAPF